MEMNKQTEALKMAIEAMNDAWFFIDGDVGYPIFFEKAIKACKKALEQTAPMQMNQTLECPSYLHGIKSYPTAPSWQSLSDDEIEYLECLKAPPVHPDFINDDSWYDFARAIEQALKELNAKK